jgi:hypothetical protein
VFTQWCNICNARPSDGTLDVILVEGGPVEQLQSCTPCALRLMKENDEREDDST